jgi:hypothetical protein
MFKLDNIAGGIGELDFFNKIGFIEVFELDNITRGIVELEVFVNIGIV